MMPKKRPSTQWEGTFAKVTKGICFLERRTEVWRFLEDAGDVLRRLQDLKDLRGLDLRLDTWALHRANEYVVEDDVDYNRLQSYCTLELYELDQILGCARPLPSIRLTFVRIVFPDLGLKIGDHDRLLNRLHDLTHLEIVCSGLRVNLTGALLLSLIATSFSATIKSLTFITFQNLTISYHSDDEVPHVAPAQQPLPEPSGSVEMEQMFLPELLHLHLQVDKLGAHAMRRWHMPQVEGLILRGSGKLGDFRVDRRLSTVIYDGMGPFQSRRQAQDRYMASIGSSELLINGSFKLYTESMSPQEFNADNIDTTSNRGDFRGHHGTRGDGGYGREPGRYSGLYEVPSGVGWNRRGSEGG
ncbi:hypothetical protein OC846_002248 [Tilletia horrida]|uniref:Uncharacterized protein n=1 Tax=Tilletia horrida TaxID=155126 RepID=A0AAN6GRN3_9BASI|nr:hypothetical protein OC846_002248 [Tilletia horrida]